MRRQKNNTKLVLISALGAAVVLAIIFFAIPGHENDQQNPASDSTADMNTLPETETSRDMASQPAETPAEPVTPAPGPTAAQRTNRPAPRKVALDELIKAAQTWMPCEIHADWFGQPAPDFTMTDIDGKQHTLSTYRGKSVVLLLWAPSFAPSLKELETVMQLRTARDPSELVIIGLSFDPEQAVRQYVLAHPSINIPIVAAQQQDLPAPYSTGKPLPCAMFITPDQIFRISVRGNVPLDDYRAILAAE